jgi:hypothetical protein
MLKIEYKEGSIIVVDSNSKIVLKNLKEIDCLAEKTKEKIESSKNECDLIYNVMFLDLLKKARYDFLEGLFKKPCL